MNYFICESCNSTTYIKDNNKFICKKCNAEHVICMNCQGTGFIITENGMFDCKECNGSGVKKKDD